MENNKAGPELKKRQAGPQVLSHGTQRQRSSLKRFSHGEINQFYGFMWFCNILEPIMVLSLNYEVTIARTMQNSPCFHLFLSHVGQPSRPLFGVQRTERELTASCFIWAHWGHYLQCLRALKYPT